MADPTRVGIAVVEHQGRFVVGVRSGDEVLPHAAEFPGGKCRPEENPEDCVVRECWEETGLSVETVRLLDYRRHNYAHGEVELHFWLCRLVAGQDPAAIRSPFRWAERDELPALPFPDANIPVIKLLQAS
jgi:mutator protein MutT